MTAVQYLLELQRDWGTHRDLRRHYWPEDLRRRLRPWHHLR
jgi:hypothetical protein